MKHNESVDQTDQDDLSSEEDSNDHPTIAKSQSISGQSMESHPSTSHSTISSLAGVRSPLRGPSKSSVPSTPMRYDFHQPIASSNHHVAGSEGNHRLSLLPIDTISPLAKSHAMSMAMNQPQPYVMNNDDPSQQYAASTALTDALTSSNPSAIKTQGKNHLINFIHSNISSIKKKNPLAIKLELTHPPERLLMLDLHHNNRYAGSDETHDPVKGHHPPSNYSNSHRSFNSKHLKEKINMTELRENLKQSSRERNILLHSLERRQNEYNYDMNTMKKTYKNYVNTLDLTMANTSAEEIVSNIMTELQERGRMPKQSNDPSNKAKASDHLTASNTSKSKGQSPKLNQNANTADDMSQSHDANQNIDQASGNQMQGYQANISIARTSGSRQGKRSTNRV